MKKSRLKKIILMGSVSTCCVTLMAPQAWASGEGGGAHSGRDTESAAGAARARAQSRQGIRAARVSSTAQAPENLPNPRFHKIRLAFEGVLSRAASSSTATVSSVSESDKAADQALAAAFEQGFGAVIEEAVRSVTAFASASGEAPDTSQDTRSDLTANAAVHAFIDTHTPFAAAVAAAQEPAARYFNSTNLMLAYKVAKFVAEDTLAPNKTSPSARRGAGGHASSAAEAAVIAAYTDTQALTAADPVKFVAWEDLDAETMAADSVARGTAPIPTRARFITKALIAYRDAKTAAREAAKAAYKYASALSALKTAKP